MRALMTGDVSYKEQTAATAARARVEVDGVSAEKSVASARVRHFFLNIFNPQTSSINILNNKKKSVKR